MGGDAVLEWILADAVQFHSCVDYRYSVHRSKLEEEPASRIGQTGTVPRLLSASIPPRSNLPALRSTPQAIGLTFS